jgi:actin-like ATPase involved in cell morphogenesis
MSVPTFSFSVTKAGDWIDQQVAMATNETTSQICAVKEKSLDLSVDTAKNGIEDALSIYYNYLIEYVLENIKEAFESAPDRPNINNPIPIILAGGTAKPRGFETRFTRLMNEIKLPFTVSSVRLAKEPLQAVAKGALVAARAHEED